MPERYGICAGASSASLGVKLLNQVSAVTVLPWHCPQLLAMPVCKTEFAASVSDLERWANQGVGEDDDPEDVAAAWEDACHETMADNA